MDPSKFVGAILDHFGPLRIFWDPSFSCRAIPVDKDPTEPSGTLGTLSVDKDPSGP